MLTLTWVILWVTGFETLVPEVGVIATSGVAILGAAFLLTWGAETAEKDVPRSIAIAVLAVIAVAPEYAVDALYAWEAGVDPGSPASMAAADLAVANMTGANRILIGIGWSGIALYAIYRATRVDDPAVVEREGFLADAVELDPRISIEILFLSIVTLYAFVIPFNGGIDGIDALFLIGMYLVYIYVIFQGEISDEVHVGVTGYLQALRRPIRIAAVGLLFVYSGVVILISVEPFAKGLETLGPQLGVSSFFMIQWVAPLASESPELIVTAYLVQKARTTASFNALISSKLNQWTLLIGTLVIVYSLSLGYYDVLAFSQRQAGEIWLTAAQSLFAITLLVDLKLSIREALLLVGLFVGQFYPYFHQYEGLLIYSGLYVVLGLGFLIVHRRHIPTIVSTVWYYVFPRGADSSAD
jgi:cation:H+ antiporter